VACSARSGLAFALSRNMFRTSRYERACLMYLAMPPLVSFLMRLKNLSAVAWHLVASLSIWWLRSSLSSLLAVSLLIEALAMLESAIPLWINSNFSMRSLAHLVGRSTASTITLVSSYSRRWGKSCRCRSRNFLCQAMVPSCCMPRSSWMIWFATHTGAPTISLPALRSSLFAWDCKAFICIWFQASIPYAIVAYTVHLSTWIWIFGRRSGSFLSIAMSAKVALLALVSLFLRWMFTSLDFLANPR
jgi:hypothetical protein